VLDRDRLAGSAVDGFVHLSEAAACFAVSRCRPWNMCMTYGPAPP
jgi:hypothetical protein